MIIPVRCFTCGKVLANKWLYYKKRVEEHEVNQPSEPKNETPADEKTFEGKLLDEMGLTRMCCRRHLLTHVDLIDVI